MALARSFPIDVIRQRGDGTFSNPGTLAANRVTGGGRIDVDLARRGGRGSWARTSIGKPPELPRGRPGPKYDVRPSAGECEPHKRIKQKEDPSDFEHKHDPDRHWGPYALEAFRQETGHDVA